MASALAAEGRSLTLNRLARVGRPHVGPTDAHNTILPISVGFIDRSNQSPVNCPRFVGRLSDRHTQDVRQIEVSCSRIDDSERKARHRGQNPGPNAIDLRTVTAGEQDMERQRKSALLGAARCGDKDRHDSCYQAANGTGKPTVSRVQPSA